MNAQQRQRLVNAGFTRKGLADMDVILDGLPTSQHEHAIDAVLRRPGPSQVRQLTEAEVAERQPLPFSDAEIRSAVTEGVGASVRKALNAITGKVD